MQAFTAPDELWYGNKELTLEFPSDWSVGFYPMAGYDRKPVSQDDIERAFADSIGAKTIRRLAEERREAVIIVDDLARPTPASQLMPFIIKGLIDGGISSDHVRVVVGLGAHGACNRIDFVKKLGEDIVEQFPVYNHNAFGNLVYLGTTSGATPVDINGEVMACDLKIAVGSVIPHPLAGFGGGAKAILPGVSGIKTITHNHREVGGLSIGEPERLHPSAGWGKEEENIFRLDIEEAGCMAGLDVKIDVLLNGRMQITDVYVGEAVLMHRRAVDVARRIYSTEDVKGVDVAVANAYPRANEATLSTPIAYNSIREGGTVVLIVNAPDGQVTHYASGKFGKHKGGTIYAKAMAPPSKLGRLIIYSRYRVKDPLLPILNPEQIIWVKSWSEVLEEIKAAHSGRVKVAVYPTADIQCPSSWLKA